jgi:hypothetical protein
MANPTGEKGRKVENAQAAAEESTIKLRKTKGKVDNLNTIASFMTKEHGIASDRLYMFNQAMTPAKIQGVDGVAVRILGVTSAVDKDKGVEIKNFDSLNEHPELILYDGYYIMPKKKTWPEEIHIEKRTGTGPSLLEKKLQDGTITELGMEKEPSGAMKLLGGFGKFLMMGGFLIVIFVIVGLIVAISILAQKC